MKTFVAALAAASVLAGVTGPASAAQTPEQRIAALERQVAALTQAPAARPTGPAQTPVDRKIAGLTRRVTTLERQLKAAQKKAADAELAAIGAFGYAGCLSAVAADAISGTWNVIDQIAAATQAGKVYFGPQPVVADGNICTALRITRAQAVPPTMVPFSALTALLS